MSVLLTMLLLPVKLHFTRFYCRLMSWEDNKAAVPLLYIETGS